MVVEQPTSASTSTSRSARRAATTATSRRGPTAAHLIDDYVDACVPDLERALRPAPSPTRRACSSVAARRRCSPPTALVRILDAIRRDRRRRGHRRVQPRQRRRGEARGLPRRRREPRSPSACSRWGPTCSPRSAARTIRRTSRGPSAAARGRRLRRPSTSTSSTARPARRSTTGARRSTACSRSTRPHVSAYALTVEPATPLGRRVAAGARRPTTTTRPTYVLADELLAAAGSRVVRGLELGAAGRGVPAQPPLLGAGRVPRDRLRGARSHRATVGAALVERAHARALHRRGRRPARRPRPARSGSTPRPGPRRPGARAADPRRRGRAPDRGRRGGRARGPRAGRGDRCGCGARSGPDPPHPPGPAPGLRRDRPPAARGRSPVRGRGQLGAPSGTRYTRVPTGSDSAPRRRPT